VVATVFPNSAQAHQIGDELGHQAGLRTRYSPDGKTVILTDRGASRSVLDVIDTCTTSAE
jgi:hypothetical protein